MAARRSPIVVLIVLFVLLFAIGQCFFTVDERERAILLQLGKPVSGALEPGLHFKLPFVQNVVSFDHRVLEYDAVPAEILTEDKKNLVVDNYSRWRIVDPLLFYRTVRTVSQATARIDGIIYSELRASLGKFTMTEIISSKRPQIMEEVTAKSDVLLAEYGIDVLDVRIKRTDLPKENQQAIFGRMRAERERQAKQYRSEGREEGAKIRAAVEKDRAVMLAEARRESEVIRGKGDAEAASIYAQALSRDPEFYSFTRSMESYRRSLKDKTRLVLTPDSEFFEYFK